MPMYRVKGNFTRTLRFDVDQEVEAESEGEAIDAVCEDTDDDQAWDSDDSVHGLVVEKIGEGAAVPPGRPLLREKDDLAALEAWTNGLPIKVSRP